MSQMSQTAAAARERAPVNKVDTRSLFATINVVRQQPDLARFRYPRQQPVARGNAQPDPHRVLQRGRRRPEARC